MTTLHTRESLIADNLELKQRIKELERNVAIATESMQVKNDTIRILNADIQKVRNECESDYDEGFDKLIPVSRIKALIGDES